jgi:hypothetical protein
MRYRTIVLMVTCSLFAACEQSAPPAEAKPAAVSPASAAVVAATPVEAVSAQPAVDADFAEDMAYATLRGRLIDSGWLPLRDPMCRENVGGTAPVCNELPEVESCSGDGRCVMHFANADDGKRIRVVTYGPYQRWNLPGEEAALAVKSWQVTALASAAASPACPSRDFDAFLKAFATDDRVEQAFIAPLVKVAELYSDDKGDHARMVYMDGAGYDDFNVNYAGNAFHYVNAEGKVDRSPLSLEVTQDGASARVVRYRYGMSEGNSYRFEEKNGCWYLTQDPDAPAP